jgi:two-component system response regulator HydG
LGREPLGIEPEALAVLREYGFPGNHTELTLMVERAVASARAGSGRLSLEDFAHSRVLAAQSSQEDPWAATLEEIEKKALLRALDRAHGNKSEAARLLGLPRTTLLDKLRRHKLDSIRAEPRAN